MKSIPKMLQLVFISVFILQMISLIALLLVPDISQAIDFTPQVGIDKTFQAKTAVSLDSNPNLIAKYIQAIYRYSIGIVGILATVVMMFGGFLWLTAAGDAGKIGEAKEWIKASITGLVIALSSYMILATINPDLVNLKMKEVKTIGKITLGCCTYKEGTATKIESLTQEACKAKPNNSWKQESCASAPINCASAGGTASCPAGQVCTYTNMENGTCGAGIPEGGTQCGTMKPCAVGLKCDENILTANRCIKP